MEEQNQNLRGKIPLAHMIQQLRAELIKAQWQSKGEPIAFKAEKVELELKIAITKTAEGKGGIEFWVINAGGSYEKSSATTHTFKLTLKPIDAATGGDVDLNATTSTKPI